MKVKRDKKLEKYSHDENTSESAKNLKSKKKYKLHPDVPTGNCDELQVADTQIVDKTLKNVDANIFKYFKELISEDEKTRLEAALHLFQRLQRNKDQEKVRMLRLNEILPNVNYFSHRDKESCPTL